jgi:transposase-like protein
MTAPIETMSDRRASRTRMSPDVRRAVIADLRAGHAHKAIARRHAVSPGAVAHLACRVGLRRYADGGGNQQTRVLEAVASGAATIAEIAARAGVPPRSARRRACELARAGALVRRVAGGPRNPTLWSLS